VGKSLHRETFQSVFSSVDLPPRRSVSVLIRRCKLYHPASRRRTLPNFNLLAAHPENVVLSLARSWRSASEASRSRTATIKVFRRIGCRIICVATGMVGIHGYHLDLGVRITYIAADQKRQVIPQVTYTEPEGKATVFNSTDARAAPEELARDEHRVMDSVNCGKRESCLSRRQDDPE
jgi:hypothetical protein